jgi:hypothetical protein
MYIMLVYSTVYMLIILFILFTIVNDSLKKKEPFPVLHYKDNAYLANGIRRYM